MLTRLIIVRHGNTFLKDQIPRRVGAKTDLELVEEHRSRSIGKYLKENKLIPNEIFSGPLKRHIQTTELICEELNLDKTKIIIRKDFSEIDYGPDENKTEEEVKRRLGDGSIEEGEKVLELWNEKALVPNGWLIDTKSVISSWKNFAKEIEEKYENKTVLLVSSNGMIRFSPYIVENYKSFIQENNIKISTGGLCTFIKRKSDEYWVCDNWNIKPYLQYL